MRKLFLSVGLLGLFGWVADAAATTPVPAGLSCPDGIVWVSGHSKVYHTAGSRWYGTTVTGAYECTGAAVKAGLRASKH